ncbi:GNAT family N-acetyltransferase [Photobacterium sp. MCCC 1A19761]|uniref:GNAT family N-acetyltransferase n=1 Tax=Photobacterium sp. MCCC 1A19761 TaxID=3115000 RepID=UPI00307E73FA
MELMRFQDEHASELVNWFQTKEESLMWGGRVFDWPLNQSSIIQRATEDNLQFFTLVEGTQVLGFIEFQRMSLTEVRLCRVAIHPAVRGKGLGRQLIQLSLLKIKALPHVTLVTLAVFQRNVVAKNCYESLGFQITDKAPHVKVFDGREWPVYQMELAL